MRIYVPGVDDKGQVEIFEIQCIKVQDSGIDIVTGNINTEVYDSCLLSLSLARLHNLLSYSQRLHFHFTQSDILKSGSSTGLGSFTRIATYDIEKPIRLIVTGELDLLGNIIEIGGFQEKIRYFYKKSSEFDGFIFPNSNLKHVPNDLILYKMFPVSNISELSGVIDEIIKNSLYNEK